MFKDAPAFSTFSVDDLQAAQQFYGQTLGLEVVERQEEGHTLLGLHVADGGPVMIYGKPDHAPASYTVLNFVVGDIEKTVDELTRRGVRFEDAEERARTGGTTGGPLCARFRDPAGNILAVMQGE